MVPGPVCHLCSLARLAGILAPLTGCVMWTHHFPSWVDSFVNRDCNSTFLRGWGDAFEGFSIVQNYIVNDCYSQPLAVGHVDQILRSPH